MRRKNRKWAAIGVGLYLFVMWSAYRWAIRQRVPEGNLFVKIEREGEQRLRAEEARAAAEQVSPPNGEARLNAAAPAYVAARYDASHVVFMVATDTESRFAPSPSQRPGGSPTRISSPAKPSAPLAGLQELWEPDSQSMHFFPEIVQKTHPGDQWLLSVSPEAIVAATIERVVVAPTGCSLAMGFLASVEDAPAFAKSAREYFVVRRGAVEPAEFRTAADIRELPGWKISVAGRQRVEQQLNSRMKDELRKIDLRLLSNAASPGVASMNVPVADARPRLKEWLHADRALEGGKGALDYDLRALLITPDSVPRLFVRSRWTLGGATVFLMTAWFRVDTANPDAPLLLWWDTSWSQALREGEVPVSLGDSLEFESVLNEFDADHDGWAELLIHSYDVHPRQPGRGGSTSLGLYLYTDKGLVPMKQALRRDLKAPESCLDP